MIIYVWKMPVEIIGEAAKAIKKNMSDLWIVWLLPMFTDEEKAKAFMWESWYIPMTQWK